MGTRALAQNPGSPGLSALWDSSCYRPGRGPSPPGGGAILTSPPHSAASPGLCEASVPQSCTQEDRQHQPAHREGARGRGPGAGRMLELPLVPEPPLLRHLLVQIPLLTFFSGHPFVVGRQSEDGPRPLVWTQDRAGEGAGGGEAGAEGGGACLLMSFRDRSLLDRDSLGCLYRYMTARPMPLCFSVSWLTLGSCRGGEQEQPGQPGPPGGLGSTQTHLHQDPQQLLPDTQRWQRLVWERADPLFDG